MIRLTPLKQPLQRSSIRAPAGARRTLSRVTRVKLAKSENALRTGVLTRRNGASRPLQSSSIRLPRISRAPGWTLGFALSQSTPAAKPSRSGSGSAAVTSVTSDPIVVPIALVATTRKWTVDCGVSPVSSPVTGTAALPAARATGGVELP